MIKIRLDVDYAYASRQKSFACTFLNVKVGSGYLKNSKIIARMINESPKEVKAYWFFTPQTLPDKEMLELMHPDRHEVALHVIKDPEKELKNLEAKTGRKANYYTVHGTERLLGQVIWKRKIGTQKIAVSKSFPLTDFWDMPTLILDRECHAKPTQQIIKESQEATKEGRVFHIHPDWIFARGKIRGPYYDALRVLLEVDPEFEWLVVQKKLFFKTGFHAGTKEYERDFVPTEQFLEKLANRADVYTFIERGWVSKVPDPPKTWAREEDNVALLHVTTYDAWWSGIGKKTRNMIRKAEKAGVTTKTVEPSEQLAEGICKIYNETPIRQGRPFPHYGAKLKDVTEMVLNDKNCTFIGAYFQNELVGFIQLVQGDNIGIISQILSLQSHWDKAVNNALVAKAVEVCAQKKIPWAMYGRIGNHPSLDTFKENHSFTKFAFTRYYVPLTKKGRLAIALGLHKPLKDALPSWLKKPLFPVFGWLSRMKMKARRVRH